MGVSVHKHPHFSALANLADALYPAQTIEQVVEIVHREVERIWGFRQLWIYFCTDESCRYLKFHSVVGSVRAEAERELPLMDTSQDEYLREAVSSAHPVYMLDAQTDPRSNKDFTSVLQNRTVINCMIDLDGRRAGLIGTGSFGSEGVVPLSLMDQDCFAVIARLVSISMDRIQHQEAATRDPLTQLNNRRSLASLAEQALKQAKRYNSQLGVIYFDLDNLKVVNDRYGHEVGDDLIRHFSHCLRHSLRESDIVARIGGDEFVVVVPEIGGISQLERFREVVLNRCAKPIKVKEGELYCHFSSGCAIFPEDGDSLEALLHTADTRMYRQKQEGI